MEFELHKYYCILNYFNIISLIKNSFYRKIYIVFQHLQSIKRYLT